MFCQIPLTNFHLSFNVAVLLTQWDAGKWGPFLVAFFTIWRAWCIPRMNRKWIVRKVPVKTARAPTSCSPSCSWNSKSLLEKVRVIQQPWNPHPKQALISELEGTLKIIRKDSTTAVGWDRWQNTAHLRGSLLYTPVYPRHWLCQLENG